jgi:hypothetical protein
VTTYHTVAGMTGDQDFQLLDDGQPLATSIQLCQVALVLRDSRGFSVATVGDVTILDDGLPGTRGKVRVNLDAADLDASRSPYSARFKVTDPIGKILYWPTADADQWIVGRGDV